MSLHMFCELDEKSGLGEVGVCPCVWVSVHSYCFSDGH